MFMRSFSPLFAVLVSMLLANCVSAPSFEVTREPANVPEKIEIGFTIKKARVGDNGRAIDEYSLESKDGRDLIAFRPTWGGGLDAKVYRKDQERDSWVYILIAEKSFEGRAAGTIAAKIRMLSFSEQCLFKVVIENKIITAADTPGGCGFSP